MSAPARTEADVRLEVAAMKARDPTIIAGLLSSARTRLENARSETALAALEFVRLVDRAAAATSETWVLETLGLTMSELEDLIRAPNPNLMQLADGLAQRAETEPAR